MSRSFLLLPLLVGLVAAPALAAAEPVPEPGSVSLLVLGATGLILGRRFSRRG